MSLLCSALLSNCGVIDEMATCSSFSIINHGCYFDFMIATTENQFCINKTFIAFFVLYT
jgi:hypothetical protein